MTMHVAYSPGSHRCGAIAIRLAVVLATAGCAVALSACGSSGGGAVSPAFRRAIGMCGGLRKR